MADKNVSDTIKQQRKAQKEFLELKKMQSGELDPGKKPSEIEIKPKTFWQKVKNIWFHDKTAICVIAVVIALLTFFTVECSMHTKPDLQIVMFTYTSVLDENCDKIEEYVTPYCEDINGDGKVVVNVINCSYNGEESNFQYTSAMLTRLQATMAAEANAMLYITDDKSYEYFNQTDAGKFFAGEKVYLDSEFYKACRVDENLTLPADLSISCRSYKNMMIEKDKNAQKYYDVSNKILEALKPQDK